MCAATPRSLVPSPVPARSSADMPSSWPELPSCTLRRAAILGRSCPPRSSGELPLSPAAAAAGCWLLLRPATSGAAAIIHAEASCHHPRGGELPSSSLRRAAIILAEASCHHPRRGELPSSTPRRAATLTEASCPIIHAEASCHHPHRGELPSSSPRRAATIHAEASCHPRSSDELPSSLVRAAIIHAEASCHPEASRHRPAFG